MSFPTVYYITQVIPSCYSAGYAMCVCVSFGACVYRSLGMRLCGSVCVCGWLVGWVCILCKSAILVLLCVMIFIKLLIETYTLITYNLFKRGAGVAYRHAYNYNIIIKFENKIKTFYTFST